MRAMARGRPYDSQKSRSAIVTLEGDNPTVLRSYRHVEQLLRKEERKLGLFGKMLTFRNVYKSRRKKGTWEAKWDIGPH